MIRPINHVKFSCIDGRIDYVHKNAAFELNMNLSNLTEEEFEAMKVLNTKYISAYYKFIKQALSNVN